MTQKRLRTLVPHRRPRLANVHDMTYFFNRSPETRVFSRQISAEISVFIAQK